MSQNNDPEEVALYLASLRGERARREGLAREYNALVYKNLPADVFDSEARRLDAELKESMRKIIESRRWLTERGVL